MREAPEKRPVWMLIATFHPIVGGAQTQVHRLSKGLIGRGRSVRILTRRHGVRGLEELPTRDLVNGIPVIRVYSHGRSILGSLLYVLNGLWHLLRYGRGDIYHAHDIGAPAWVAVLARHLLGGRCVIKLRSGRLAYQQRLSSKIATLQFRALLRLADRIVVVNRELEDFVTELGIPRPRVIHIPNSVDTDAFLPACPEDKVTYRQRLGLPTEKTILLYVGRLEPKKGIDTLLQAWATLPEFVRSEALLVLVGDGSDRENLHRMIHSQGLHQSVLLAGLCESVRDYYWASDIFVLPSKTEGMSNALIEAMACGLPVIASDVGGSSELIEDGKNGMTFEPGRSEQLRDRMALILTMRHSWPDLGSLARQTVITSADLTTVVDRVQEVYLQLT